MYLRFGLGIYFKLQTHCLLNYRETKSQPKHHTGWAGGLVVIGGVSCSKGHEFESEHQILMVNFSPLFVERLN